MLQIKKYIFPLLFIANSISAQTTVKPFSHLNDSLLKLMQSPQVKKMSFDDLIVVQKIYTTLDKDVRIGYLNELLNRKDFMADDKKRAEAYYRCGYNLQFMGDDFPKAKYYLTESIRLYSKLNNPVKKAEAMRALGVYHQSRDEDSLAIALYTQSQQIAESANDTTGILRPYSGMVFLYTKIGLYSKAITYGLEGIRRARFYKDSISLAFISNNTGNAYLKAGKYDTALYHYKIALSINKDAENIIRNCSNIGNAYLFLNKIDSATAYLNRVEALLPQTEVPRVLIFAYSYLAKLRNAKGEYNESLNYAKKAIELSDKFYLNSISDIALEELVKSYKQLKMPDSALVGLENYWAIKKNYLEEGRNKSVTEIEQQFQQYKKDNEILLLKKDKELGKTQRNGAFVTALLLAIAAFLFYTRFRLKKKTSDALSVKNQEIEKQKELIQSSLGEKETLLREIHHRVKNNLQIISSLLNIQSEHIQDENVLSSIKEGQSRVQAMSLIHQNLYQSEHLNNVDIQNYVQQLVVYLSEMFAGQSKHIQVNVNAPGINFDIDTAIPLGLIINELVSNAYKYAFEKHASGKINISIKPATGDDYELEIRDDGKGLAVDTNPNNSSSLGLKLVKILSRQLRGTFSFKSDNGAVFLVQFKDLRAYQTTQI